MDIKPNTLGHRIRELRQAQGKTLRELAAQVGVSHQFLHMLEMGVKHGTDHMPALAAALGVDVSYFTEDQQ